MTRYFHRYGLGNARSREVTGRASSEVMNERRVKPARLTGGAPSLSEVTDLLTV
jgi:hypothetical protein